MRIRRSVAVFLLALAACGDSGAVEGRRIVASPEPVDENELVIGSPTASITPAPRVLPTPDRPPAGAQSAPAATSAAAADLSRARIKLTKIATLNQPLALAVRKGDSALYIAEQGGKVKAIRGGKVSSTLVLNISSQVSTAGNEEGLLGLTFSPSGSKMYVYFTNTSGDNQVREYAFSAGRAQASTARDVIKFGHPVNSNHNGGNIMFGRDGFLYIGTGDGGAGGDPNGNAQNLESLLGKMIRIDPRASGSDAYRIPPDNPFVGRSGRDEIWAYGLRNPWRWSFDRRNGDLWTGDVGQGSWEEVDFQAGSSDGGENYGWDRMEGTHRFEGSPPANHVPPIYEYANGEGGTCSVTGGYVYRGARIPDLYGAYVFADYCAARLQAFKRIDGQARQHGFLGVTSSQLTSFGQDHNGELYVLSRDGPVSRIDRA